MKGYSISNLNKDYTVNSKKHRVLKNINLNIESDRITIILGKSGCGKTTLLRLLGGLEKTTSGSILFYKDETEFKPKIGMVFQESRLMPWLTVRENITFYLSKRHKEIEDKFLKLMKLENFSEAYPNQLSGGMAHRVSIARALAYEPDIMLMDEPFAALDYFTRYNLQKEIINLYEETKKGIVFVTHNIDEAILLGHRIIILDKGKVIRDCNIEENYPRDLTLHKLMKIKEDILKALCEHEY
ncbi:sulfonate transport system ATP-binding protein [Clostridium tetanomorphum]|uniref:ABC transporter ATP-binding protein n=1 Tax=Clostridium tetanomorphum TaxID=1553 RepID=A0A923J0B2_CLOTT|nr:ABC transporter ATP-binding protein [Clostridium tetanomorphum]MBC2397539.1 ABC transporter ATP-binding protein [Clostridium tetanomorphum]MBP1863636.1 sulfonate transport system ATP-binding protein [Clostridium tetanomorphum]NRS86212.1 sulfonate transport system ATP-binding protein [Clostridium tetanomorphum]NRZ95709.1 sulfonate transport system ATP-binding protein [Clostridium tetanomorphum]SQC00784.1 aliphatic sulfonates ABC transporter ATP-binding protein [Clostridium tetanomorphum]